MRALVRRLGRFRLAHFLEVARAFRRFERPARVVAAYLGVLTAPEVVRLRKGPVIRLAGWEDLLSVWGVWVRDDYPVDRADRLVVDAGANIGAFALRAATEAPAARIVALEPVSRTFRQLEANVRDNGLTGRVRAVPLGVAGDSGPRVVALGEASAFSTMFRDAPQEGSERIVTRSLDDLLGEIGSPDEVDLLKMDCEGAEMECLLAAPRAALRRFRTIALEFHEIGGFTIDQLQEHLREAGFATARLERQPDSICGFARFERQ